MFLGHGREASTVRGTAGRAFQPVSPVRGTAGRAFQQVSPVRSTAGRAFQQVTPVRGTAGRTQDSRTESVHKIRARDPRQDAGTFAGSDASTHSHERHGHRGERAGGTGSHTCMASSRRCQDRQESIAMSKCTLAWGVLGKHAEQ